MRGVDLFPSFCTRLSHSIFDLLVPTSDKKGVIAGGGRNLETKGRITIQNRRQSAARKWAARATCWGTIGNNVPEDGLK